MYRIMVMVIVVVVNFQNLNVNVHHHHHHRLSILYIVRNDDLPTSTREWRNHQTEKKQNGFMCKMQYGCVCVSVHLNFFFFFVKLSYIKKNLLFGCYRLDEWNKKQLNDDDDSDCDAVQWMEIHILTIIIMTMMTMTTRTRWWSSSSTLGYK